MEKRPGYNSYKDIENDHYTRYIKRSPTMPNEKLSKKDNLEDIMDNIPKDRPKPNN